MKKMLLMVLFLFGTTSPYAQPTIRDESIRPELDKAFEPLKTLSLQQMTAVTGLVLAAPRQRSCRGLLSAAKEVRGFSKISL